MRRPRSTPGGGLDLRTMLWILGRSMLRALLSHDNGHLDGRPHFLKRCCSRKGPSKISEVDTDLDLGLIVSLTEYSESLIGYSLPTLPLGTCDVASCWAMALVNEFNSD